MNIREGRPDELEEILSLLPRLASFVPPGGRNPDDLWRGDADTVRAWANGTNPDCFVVVAVEGNAPVSGIAVVTLAPEAMSGAPGAHLEAIALAPEAQGKGVGTALISAAERMAQERGATCLTLHVFEANTHALKFYERLDYIPEYKRCIKYLGQT